MSSPVKTRKYHSPRRRLAAEETKRRILASARHLFAADGFEATPVAKIAEHAGVSVDTVYATVGRKPKILLAVHDMALAGASSPLDADDRDYVRQIRATPTAREKLTVYADALAERLPTTAPLLIALRAAGAKDSQCLAMYREITERRAANMRLLATELEATGQLRAGLGVEAVATLLWSMNSAEYFTLLIENGTTPGQYAELVKQCWTHSLLPDEE